MSVSRPHRPHRRRDAAAGRGSLWHFDLALGLKALAAGLIQAVIYWPSAAFDLVLPLRQGIELQIRPGLVVPVFVGLTQGPLAGALTGAVGHLLGELLGGRLSGPGALAIGVLQSALLGFLAGLGSRWVARALTLRTLGTMLFWACVAGVGANLLPAGLVLLWAAVQPGLTVDANIIFSGIITTLVNSLLLLPALLFVWSRAAAPRP